jgi:hypothetical protein
VRDVWFSSVAATTFEQLQQVVPLAFRSIIGQDGVTRAGYNGLGTLAKDPYHLSALVHTRAMGPLAASSDPC